MENRKQDLLKLKEYIESVDKETTLLLQNLQWDHKHLLESPAMVSCKYEAEHRMPMHAVEAHEKQCYLRQQGYSKEDVLLPDLINPEAETIVKLNKQDIMKIIGAAAAHDPSFKRVSMAEPLSVERLQQAYSADERRAIHDAVVAAAPACHDLADLALPSSSGGAQAGKSKSRAEILAELRDMKRRRAKYRVAAKTCNYSDVLRDVIKTQMDLYAEAKGIFIKTEYGSKTYVSLNQTTENEVNPADIVIKKERITPEPENQHEISGRRKESGRSNDDRRHRSRSSDRRRQRREFEERGSVLKHRRDHFDSNSLEKKRYKDSQERRKYNEDHSKRDFHRSTKDIQDISSRYYSPAESSSSKDGNHYDRKTSKYDNYKDSSKYSSKYDHSSNEHRSSSYREGSSNSEYERKRTFDEYRSHSESKRYREDKQSRHYDDRNKKEKVDYGYNEEPSHERRKRQKH